MDNVEEFNIVVEDEEVIDITSNIENDFLKGETGDTGPANTLTIGTVAKGEDASAEITGEAPNQTLNLVLPKGDKGETGEQGIQGQPGYTPIKGTDYFTEEEISQIKSDILGQINQFEILVVQELPTEDIDDHTIYFVPKTEAEQQDVYDEYIRINNSWEHIGTTEVDLSSYYNKTEIDSKFDNIQALPEGGTIGQVLTKNSDGDGDASWKDGVTEEKEIFIGNPNNAPNEAKIVIDPNEITQPLFKETNIMEIGFNNDVNLNLSSLVKINFNKINKQIGSNLYFENGGIRIGRGIRYIIVSGTLFFRESNYPHSARLQVFNETKSEVLLNPQLITPTGMSSTYFSADSSIRVAEVNEGDFIVMKGQLENVNSCTINSLYTNLTVIAIG